MAIYKTYIQQIRFDGTSYTTGSVVDILDTYKVMCQEFPFKRNPKPKALPSRDWAGEDGLDIYIPDGGLPMNAYDIEVTFLYVGTEDTITNNLKGFLDFITGRRKGQNANTVQSGRLAIFNEYVNMGRKDVVVSEIDNELYYCSDNDPDAVAKFKVKFTVNDPTTEVRKSTTSGVVTGLVWTE